MDIPPIHRSGAGALVRRATPLASPAADRLGESPACRRIVSIRGRLLELSPKGTFAVVEQASHLFHVLRAGTCEFVHSFDTRVLQDKLESVHVSLDERRIAWQFENHLVVQTLGDSRVVEWKNRGLVNLDPQGRYIVFDDVTEEEDWYGLYFFDSGKEVRLDGRPCAISPDGNWIALGGDKRLWVWNVLTKETRTLLTKIGFHRQCSFRNDGRELLYASGDQKTFIRFSIPDGRVLHEVERPEGGLYFYQNKLGNLVVLQTSDGMFEILGLAGPADLRIISPNVLGDIHVGRDWIIYTHGPSKDQREQLTLLLLDPLTKRVLQTIDFPEGQSDHFYNSTDDVYSFIGRDETITVLLVEGGSYQKFNLRSEIGPFERRNVSFSVTEDQKVRLAVVRKGPGGDVTEIFELDLSKKPIDVSAAVREAALVRSVVAREDRRMEGGVGGFLNRGIHAGRGVAPGGFDYFGSRRYQAGDRIDWAATARTDVLHGMEFRNEQSRKVMIVVDPRIFARAETGRADQARAIVAAIAQMAIRRRNAVGLIIGNREVYLPPTHNDAVRLERIMGECMAYVPQAREGDVVAILTQDILRKNLPPDSEVYFVSDFSTVDPAKFETVAAHYRRVNVHLAPVKVGNELEIPEPVIELGGREYEIAGRDLRRLLLENTSRELPTAIQTLLRRNRGVVVPTESRGGVDAVTRTVHEFSRPAETRELALGTPALVGRQVIHLPDTSDKFVMDWIREAMEDVTGVELNMLYITAKVRGWGMVLNYLHRELSRMAEFFERGVPWRIRTNDEWIVGELLGFAKLQSPSISFYFSDPPDFSREPREHLEAFCELLENDRAVRFTETYFGKQGVTLTGLLEHVMDGDYPVADLRSRVEKAVEGGVSQREHVFGEALLSTFDNPFWIEQWIGTTSAIPLGPWTTEWGDFHYSWQGFPLVRKWLLDRAQKNERSSKRAPVGRRRPQPVRGFNPANQAVNPERDRRPWLILDRALREDQSYFPVSVGVTFDPATCAYHPHPELGLEAFRRGGGGRMTGRMQKVAPAFSEIPAPQGGRFIRKDRKGEVEFELSLGSPEEVYN